MVIEEYGIQMIFITLGSQKFQFNRILIAVDDFVNAGLIDEEIFAQIGYSDYRPRNFQYKEFLDRKEFSEIMNRADIVITHGGTGAIVGALKKNKKVIAVPRRAKYREHVDDHQLQLVKEFQNLNLIYECDDCSKLVEAIKNVRAMHFNSYHSNTETYIKSITAFLEKDKSGD